MSKSEKLARKVLDAVAQSAGLTMKYGNAQECAALSAATSVLASHANATLERLAKEMERRAEKFKKATVGIHDGNCDCYGCALNDAGLLIRAEMSK